MIQNYRPTISHSALLKWGLDAVELFEFTEMGALWLDNHRQSLSDAQVSLRGLKCA